MLRIASSSVRNIMTRRNHHKTFATDAALAGVATAMTLWHRLPMMVLHALMPTAESRREQDRFIPEKTTAMFEGALQANAEAARLMGAAALGRLSASELAEAPFAIAAAGMQPAFRTVRGNAKRLSRRR
jgi:hypothetical protein